MVFDNNLKMLLLAIITAIAVISIILVLFFPKLFGNSVSSGRMKSITNGISAGSPRTSMRTKLFSEDQKGARSRQLHESLNKLTEAENQRKKRLTMRARLQQAGLAIPLRAFWTMAVGLGSTFTLLSMFFGLSFYVCAAAFVVGTFGIPIWVIGFIRNRRLNRFLNDFAEAIDVMVRGLKAGLPMNEAMKVIATEMPEPVGPEFVEVVEGQKIGIPVDQGLQRMYERTTLSEVNFLAIVLTIQSKSGGNLAEALSNLSRVLRERKKMQAKIKSVSQEAKSSAAIIGALPFLILAGTYFLAPGYLDPLFNEKLGHIILAGSGAWMFLGVLIMRKMINFKI